MKGVLERKHIQADVLVYIGKEANNIEDQPLDVTGAQVFINEEEIKQKILALTPEEARKLGIKHRSTLKRIKDRIIKKENINIKSKQVKNILIYYIILGRIVAQNNRYLFKTLWIKLGYQ